MVLEDRNSSTSDEDVDSAESAAGAMAGAQGTAAPAAGAGAGAGVGAGVPPPSAAIAIVGATAAASGESFSSAFSALPQEALQVEVSQARLPLGPPPGFSSQASRPDSPLPSPREPSVLLEARLSELNRLRDLLIETLQPMNADQLDEWVNIQLQRDYVVRASFCQTSNDVLLAEVRRLRQMVNQAIQRLNCPSTPVLLFRGALEQILSFLPGVVEHLRSPRPHEDIEEEAWPTSQGQAPLDPSNLKGINLFGTVFQEPFLPLRGGPRELPPGHGTRPIGEGPPGLPRAHDSHLGRLPIREGLRALPPAHESPLGHLPIIPGDPSSVSVHDGDNGTTNGGGDDFEDEFDRLSLSRRRRERRRARSEEFRARNPSPQPLMPGDVVSCGQMPSGPMVVVAGGHGAIHRWVSPGVGGEDPTQDSSEIGGMPPEVQDFPLEVQEYPPELELPTMPLLDSGSFRPLMEEASSALTGPTGHLEDREANQSCLSSPGSSPHLLFNFTDERELGIRRRRRTSSSRNTSKQSSPTTTTTTTTSSSSQGDDQPRQRRRRVRRVSTTESSSMARTESGSTRTTESLRSDDDDTTSRDYETSMTVQEFSEEEEQKE